MKKFTVLLLLAAAIFLSGCTFSTAGLEIQPNFASELTRNCGTISEVTVVNPITGVDANGDTLSFWTPTLKGIQMAVEEAGELCQQIDEDDVRISWPDYRCQFRIDIDLKAAACQLPK